MPRTCPDCHKTFERIQRKAWMRCIPSSKLYLCWQCGYSFLLIFNRWLFKLGYQHFRPGTL
ncbi:MAG: hypothetical protein M0P73_11025 [Syntrophobacterales bacterium]|nr:hypothetical protein [Syntrophobacterales bacterium]